MLALENLQKNFGSRIVLDHISYRFPDGEKVALVGANGAGKTTLLNILTGLEAADGGRTGQGQQRAAAEGCRLWHFVPPCMGGIPKPMAFRWSDRVPGSMQRGRGTGFQAGLQQATQRVPGLGCSDVKRGWGSWQEKNEMPF